MTAFRITNSTRPDIVLSRSVTAIASYGKEEGGTPQGCKVGAEMSQGQHEAWPVFYEGRGGNAAMLELRRLNLQRRRRATLAYYRVCGDGHGDGNVLGA